ncbi:polyprenyl synthetase family protein [Kocuria sp. CPCC 205235]|uniref:polyprenyl synthetase family protein n=1 Tax=Kocuria sp. CPCC 205235 TaxID=3073549 RepID=UPI0034D5D675
MTSSRLTHSHHSDPASLRRDGAVSDDHSWDAFRTAVIEELDAYFDGLKDAVTQSPGFPVLRSRVRDQVTGGKLLRPRLTHLAWRAFAGHTEPIMRGETRNIPDPDCVRLAASFELLHAALLVHDDVVDRDPVRRGRPTVGELYRRDAQNAGAPSNEARHLGEAAAIIGGDLLLSGALQLATTCTADPARLQPVAAVVFDAVTASAAGELDDVLLSMHRYGRAHPVVQDILSMERLKTATYSFEAPLKAGALLAGADQDDAARLAQAGSRIGVAYQVVDDILGTFGDAQITGKSTEADLREGKATVLTAHGMKDQQARQVLTDFAAGRVSVGQVKTALAEAGAETSAVELATDLVAQAREALEDLPLPDEERAELDAICHYVLHRRK